MIALTLLLKYWHYAALVAAISFGAILWHTHNVDQQEIGAYRERVKTLDSLRAVNAQQIVRVDTVYQHDTVTLTRAITKTQTLRDSLLVHITDTLRVKEYIASADSTITACKETVLTCDQFHALALQRFALDDARLAAALKAQPKPHWYDGRISIGPSVQVTPNGRASVGVGVQLNLIRFP